MTIFSSKMSHFGGGQPTQKWAHFWSFWTFTSQVFGQKWSKNDHFWEMVIFWHFWSKTCEVKVQNGQKWLIFGWAPVRPKWSFLGQNWLKMNHFWPFWPKPDQKVARLTKSGPGFGQKVSNDTFWPKPGPDFVNMATFWSGFGQNGQKWPSRRPNLAAAGARGAGLTLGPWKIFAKYRENFSAFMVIYGLSRAFGHFFGQKWSFLTFIKNVHFVQGIFTNALQFCFNFFFTFWKKVKKVKKWKIFHFFIVKNFSLFSKKSLFWKSALFWKKVINFFTIGLWTFFLFFHFFQNFFSNFEKSEKATFQ